MDSSRILVLHIRSLDEETLARKTYEEQKANNWPGLAKETRQICQSLSIEDVNITKLTKKKYRKLITKACHIENEKRLRKQAEGKVKCTKIENEKYGKKDYIKDKDIFAARQIYRTRFGMQPFAGNYSRDRRFARTEWLCRCREAREDESHLMDGQCPVYQEIHEKYQTLDDDETLAQFFNEILSMRDKLDKKES